MPEGDGKPGFLDTCMGKIAVTLAAALLVAGAIVLYVRARAEWPAGYETAVEGTTGPTKSRPPIVAPKGPTMTKDRPESGAPPRREGGTELQGLKVRPMWITHMGCLIGCAEYLKIDASPAWIYGGCGHAFALNVHEVICPSGPTAWRAEMCDALAANVGIAVDGSAAAHKSHEDFAAKQEALWKRTCEALDAGLPSFGWEMDIPEWYVVHGYDAEGNYLFRDFGDKTGKRHYTKLGDTGIGFAHIRVVKRGKAADDRTVVREAIRFALEHGAGKHSNDKWHTGLSGYDTWIQALESEEALRNEVIGFGCAYNAQCWSECRRYAVAFLKEAKKRIDDDKLNGLFDEAIGHYTVVRDHLNAVGKMFPFDVGDEKGMDERIRDAERRAKALEALKAARDAEAAALKVLAKIADVLGK